MAEINPILVKELRSRMRGARAFVFLTVYLFVLSVVTLLLYAALVGSIGTDLNAGRQIGRIHRGFRAYMIRPTRGPLPAAIVPWIVFCRLEVNSFPDRKIDHQN